MTLTLPHSIDDETAVIGACMLDKDAAKIAVKLVDPSYFYSSKLRRIFSAIVGSMRLRKSADLNAIMGWLEARKELEEVGGIAALGTIVQRVASAAAIHDSCRRVAEYHRRRELIKDADRMQREAADITKKLPEWKAAAAPITTSKYTPHHDEIGDTWLASHEETTVYTRDKWYRYKRGVWRETLSVELEVWKILIQGKQSGVVPKKSTALSVLHYIAEHQRRDDEFLTAAPGLVCFPNGVYNIESGQLLPHSPDYRCTTQMPFEYSATAECKRWMQALVEWHSATPRYIEEEDRFETEDESAERSLAVIAHLQEAVGYSLTTDNHYQVAWMLVGDGENGKDKFLDAIRALAGEAHLELDLAMLAKTQYGIASVPNKRVVTCTETPEHGVADAYLKRLISGEKMEARQIRLAPFNFEPICKLWWAVNEKPTVSDASHGYWRRWIIVPFRESFSGRCERGLKHKLLAELPGIFRWAMEGERRLRDRGHFNVPDECRRASDRYRKDQDSIALWLDECCLTPEDDDYEVLTYSETPRDLFSSYASYCDKSRLKAKGIRRFGDDLERRGYPRIRYHGERLHKRLKLKDAWRVSHTPFVKAKV